MTLLSAFLLAVVMLVLAAVPSASVALVIARATTHGVASGCAAAAGVVTGDLIFVVLALAGLSALADSMGSLFSLLRFAAGGYLIWIGVDLLRRARDAVPRANASARATRLRSALAGLVLTLGDLKAILFYSSLLPVFLDLTAVSAIDAALVIGITTVCVGGVKLAYAFAADRLVRQDGWARRRRGLGHLGGSALIATGTALIVKP